MSCSALMYGVSEENRLTASLRRDHEVILRALERLEERVVVWKRTGKVDQAILMKFIEFARTFIDRCNYGKEERCLFPCLERGDSEGGRPDRRHALRTSAGEGDGCQAR